MTRPLTLAALRLDNGGRPVSADLDRLQAVADAATPGPWVPYNMADADFDSANGQGWWWVWQESRLPYYGGVLNTASREDPPLGSIGECSITDQDDGGKEKADAEFIATFDPPTVSALLAQIRTQAEQIRRLEEAREECERQYQAKVAEVNAEMTKLEVANENIRRLRYNVELRDEEIEAQSERAEASEATLAKVKALADEIRAELPERRTPEAHGAIEVVTRFEAALTQPAAADDSAGQAASGEGT